MYNNASKKNILYGKNFLIKKTLSSTLAIFVERITNFIISIVSARCLGSILLSSWITANYFALIIKIICADRIAQVFTPINNEIVTSQDKNDSKKKIGVYLLLLATTVLIFSLILIAIIAFHKMYNIESKMLNLAIKIFIPVMIYAILTSISHGFIGILNLHGKFFIPASLLTVYNIVIITVIFFSYVNNLLAENILYNISYFSILAGIIQLIIIITMLARLDILPKFNFNINFLINVIKLKFSKFWFYGILTSITNYLDRFNMIAAYISQTAVGSFYICGKIAHLPLMFTVTAIGNSSIVAMTKASKEGNYQKVFEILKYCIRIIFYISIPFIILVFTLKFTIINTLYGGYRYTSIHETVDIMNMFLIKIPFECYVIILNTFFYSIKKAHISVIISVIFIIIDYIIAVICIYYFNMNVFGIIIGSCVYSISCGIALHIILLINYSEYFNGTIFNTIPDIFKNLISSTISIIAIKNIYDYSIKYITNIKFMWNTISLEVIAFIFYIVLYFIIYIFINAIIKSNIQRELFQNIKKITL